MDEAQIRTIFAQLQTVQRILVVSHQRPDGDAIGSLLGFGLALQAAGKTVQMVSADGVPTSCRYLVGYEQVVKKPEGAFDYIIVVDCSDIKRVGIEMQTYPQPDLNIDHHVTNENFARFNLVDPQAVATAEILAELLPALGLPITQVVAASLLTGLITDSLGFRTSNMTPKVLRLAADLTERGANLPELYNASLMQRSYNAIQYWAAGLSHLQRNGRMIWTTLTLADRKTADYPGRDDADLINVLSSVSDIDVALIFVEQSHHKVKVSWRAQPGIDVSQIAQSFGGGGHLAAAGAEIQGNLEAVCHQVLLATQVVLESVAVAKA
jgi:phosphoesterase RecJ-like protein